MSDRSTHLPDAQREVVNTRVFAASRSEVFDAVCDPQRLAQWWGPKGFSNTFDVFDPQPGGAWHFTMHSPDGTQYYNESEFKEITRPERLVFEHLRPMHWYRMVMTFAEANPGTRLTWRMTFETEEEVQKIGAFVLAANEENFDRLEAHLALRAQPREFYITRTFAAPPAAVFQAWVDPRQLANWWGPHAFINPVCEMDPRQGGAYRIVMRSPEGVDLPITGVIQTLEAPTRLAFTMDLSEHPEAWHDQLMPDREPANTNPAGQLLARIDFIDESPERTKVVVRLQFESAELREAFLRIGITEGWNESLDGLGALLANS